MSEIYFGNHLIALLQELFEIFSSDQGKKFLRCCSHFDPNDFDEDEVKEASAQFVKFFTTDVEKKAKAFAKLARMSSRLYVMSMEALEALSMMNHPKEVSTFMKEYKQELYTAEQVFPLQCNLN